MTLFEKKTITETSSSELYVAALNCMIEGKFEKAMDLLKQSVRLNTDNIDAYLKLGILYRQTGQPAHAFRMHNELTVRPNISAPMRYNILRNMILDLEDMKEYEKALHYIKELQDIDKRPAWGWERKIKIYEEIENWKEAFNVYKQYHTDKNETVKKRLACYKVEEGKALMSGNELSAARECFAEAAKLYMGFPAPYVFAGDTYMMENETEQALATWEQLIMDAPERSSPVFTRFEKVTFEEGHFDDMERIYSYVIDKDPKNKYALLHLGEFYFRKGEYEQAVSMMNRLLEIDPKSLIAYRNLVRYLENSSVPKPFLDIVHELTELIPVENVYLCTHCGSKTPEILTRCPSCNTWDSFEY